MPPVYADAVASLKPDIVVFTEYMHDDIAGTGADRSRELFIERLLSHGLINLNISRPDENGFRSNRVLIASKMPTKYGDISPPNYHGSFSTNVLHVHVPSIDLEVLGLRVEYFKGPTKHEYLAPWWEWLDNVMRARVGSRFIAIGDLNTDIDRRPSQYGRHLKEIVECGWHFPSPVGGVSYYAHSGAMTRIDHALVSTAFPRPAARYVAKSGRFVLGSPTGVLSDHAALVVDLDVGGP